MDGVTGHGVSRGLEVPGKCGGHTNGGSEEEKRSEKGVNQGGRGMRERSM